MMDDYISRAAALTALGERPLVWTDNNEYALGAQTQYDCDVLAIQTVPANDSNALECDGMRWIPCAERLPEEGQMVIVTIRGHDLIRCDDGETLEEAIDRVMQMLRVSVGFLYDDGWSGVDGYAMMVQPVAWMPLPEPYKEEI